MVAPVAGPCAPPLHPGWEHSTAVQDCIAFTVPPVDGRGQQHPAVVTVSLSTVPGIPVLVEPPTAVEADAAHTSDGVPDLGEVHVAHHPPAAAQASPSASVLSALLAAALLKAFPTCSSGPTLDEPPRAFPAVVPPAGACTGLASSRCGQRPAGCRSVCCCSDPFFHPCCGRAASSAVGGGHADTAPSFPTTHHLLRPWLRRTRRSPM